MYKERDVVMMKSGYSGGSTAYVVTGPGNKPGEVRATALSNKRNSFRLPEHGIAGKIGTLQDCEMSDIFAGLTDAPVPAPFSPFSTTPMGWTPVPASEEPRNDTELSKWSYLNTLKSGDTVLVIMGRSRKVQACTFNQVLPRNPKYVFAATKPSGTRYKFPITSLVLPKVD